MKYWLTGTIKPILVIVHLKMNFDLNYFFHKLRGSSYQGRDIYIPT
jgi:hypothetical protein